MNFKHKKTIYLINTCLINSHLKINIIISLFIFSCSENEIQIISNTLSDLPDKNYKINLLLNPDKFRTGSIIDVEHDPTVIVTPPKRVPDFRDAKIGEIPFIIKSDSLGTKNIPNEGVALRAKITPKDGTDFSPELKIECIDERHQKPFWPDKIPKLAMRII